MKAVRGFWIVAVALIAVGCVPDAPAPTNTATVTVGGQVVRVDASEGLTVAIGSTDLSDLPTPPTGSTFPVGALHITVSNVAPGGVTRVTLRLERPVDGIRKLLGSVWDPFVHNGTTGATISTDHRIVTLDLQDGGRGDSDGVANGTIRDPLLPFNLGPATGCYDSSTAGNRDLYYSGPVGSYKNVETMTSTDGSCSGGTNNHGTLVLAASNPAALAACPTAYNAAAFNVLGYNTMPADARLCVYTAFTLLVEDQCYRTDVGVAFDLQFVGPRNSLNNLEQYSTLSGQCGGTPRATSTVVQAPTHDEALALCQAISPTFLGAVVVPTETVPSWPADVFDCSTTPDPVGPATGCYDSSTAGNRDLYYSGPVGSYKNVETMTSTDGSCSGGTNNHGTLVLAASNPAALAACPTAYNAAAFNVLGYNTMPADARLCVYTAFTLLVEDQCYRTDVGVAFDLQFVGPRNSLNNLEQYSTLSGQCGGTPRATSTVVQAPTHDEALALCQAISPTFLGAVVVPTETVPSWPADVFDCSTTPD